MKKEEILEKSKKENKNKDIYALEVENKGATIAAVVMVILAFIYFTYEIMSGKGTNEALYSIITVYNTILFGYRAIKIKEYRKINLATSIIWGLLTITLILSYFNVL